MSRPASGKPGVARKGGWRLVLAEALGVLLAGGLLAFAANALSSKGLSLTRDYFPVARTTTPPPPDQATNSTTNGTVASATNAVLARLRSHGLHPIDLQTAVERFRDPRRDTGLIVFVDIRNDDLYQEGHIPGAFQLDYYNLDPYLPDVLAACQTADQVIVYCMGDDCEDSELGALLLGKVVNRDKIFVYTGGFRQWAADSQPVEIGVRGSGVLKETSR